MKNDFVVTRNVELFMALVNSLKERGRGIDGMALVYGDPGLGKTQTAKRYAAHTNSVYFRLKEHTTLRSMLEGIVFELGQAPLYRTSDLYNQVKKVLQETQRLLIIDEIDYVAVKRGGLETLRDLSDETGAPVLMIGMMDALRSIARFEHLHDRLRTHILKFHPLAESDVKKIFDQLCEVPVDESTYSYVSEKSGGKLRAIFREIHMAEKIAKINDLRLINAGHLRKVA